MLPAQIAFILAAGYLLLCAAIGAVTGSLASAILKQRWRLSTLFIDVGTACAAMIVAVLAAGSYDYYHGTLHDNPKLYVLAGAVAPFVLHLARFMLSRHEAAPSK